MTIEQLITFNKQGLIPGPLETLDEFLKRVEFCLHLKEEFSSLTKEDLPYDKEDLNVSLSLIEDSSLITEPLYDIKPFWTPFFFSNYKLFFWQAGAAWIFQLNTDSPLSAFFQLRRSLKKNHRYLYFYNRQELISHELSHVGRMAFEEPKFEELLAYRSSTSPFRKYFGSLFTHSYQSVIVLLFCFFCFGIDLYSFIFNEDLSILGYTLKSCLGVYLIYLLSDLFIRQNHFKKAYRKLEKILRNPVFTNATIYRLTDAEIIFFSKESIATIQTFIKQENSLRWQIIKGAYFHD